MTTSSHTTNSDVTYDYDVIIVGAGFAGLTAARELQTFGISHTIVEAKDRIGGRAWTDDRMGHPLEIGATWVHWQQPHVWAEITRYKQEVYTSPDGDEASWVSDGKVYHGTAEELGELFSRPQAKIFENSRKFFPNPFKPLAALEDPEIREEFLAADHKSPLEDLSEEEFSQQERDVVNGYWSSGTQGDVHNASSLMVKHWGALTDHRIELFDEQTIRFKLKNGMRGLYNAIAADLDTESRLNTPVTKIEHTTDYVRVTYANGETETAREAIVTVPIGALRNIDFQPPLDGGKAKLIEEGWNTNGFKIWIKIKGHHNIMGVAPRPNVGAFLRSEFFLDDDTTICVGFGADHNEVDLNSVECAQKIVDQWRPDLEVVDCTSHDWVADPYAGQTWATLKKGQFTDGWHHFRETDTALNFAGSDWCEGWRGIVVDGALENSLNRTREVIARLKGSS